MLEHTAVGRSTSYLVLLSATMTALLWAWVTLAEARDGSNTQFTASTYWNKVARILVSDNALDPVSASRIYAFLSIAQHDALAAATQGDRGRRSDLNLVGRAAVTESSFAVLSQFFPSSIEQIAEAYRYAKAAEHKKVPIEAITEGALLGQNVAERVLARAHDDGSDRGGEVAVPSGHGHWRNEPDRPPLRPYWGQVRPLLMESADRFVAKAPPGVGSLSFRSALAQVRFLSAHLDREQRGMVQHWADGVRTPTAPGHWNEIATELIAYHSLSEKSAAKTLALLNIALFDTGIACWKTKYTYWLARPSQMDLGIKPNISLPNFPSYPSGHASFSGAAAEILSQAFPDQGERIRRLAEQAAISRVYAGLHFSFDSDEGLKMGRRIGRLAAKLERYPGELLPHLK